ncbi:hypothetical protein D918_00909 [Trichuris suis]|nr:hypothetical protein D918_00909 [Trichuris suis]
MRNSSRLVLKVDASRLMQTRGDTFDNDLTDGLFRSCLPWYLSTAAILCVVYFFPPLIYTILLILIAQRTVFLFLGSDIL